MLGIQLLQNNYAENARNFNNGDCNSRPHGISHRSDRVVGLEVRLEVRWERQIIEKYIVITVVPGSA